MSGRVNVLKPVSWTVTEYVPGCTVSKRYAPVASVVVSRDVPVPLLWMVTVAPGTAAPVSSLTLPTSDPYNTCAPAAAGSVRSNSNAIWMSTRARWPGAGGQSRRRSRTELGI